MIKFFLPSFLLLLSNIPLQAIDANDLHCKMSELTTQYIKQEYFNKFIEPTLNITAPQGTILKLKGDSAQNLSNCHFHITDALGKNLDDKLKITPNPNILKAEENILPFSFRIEADDLPQDIEIDCLVSLFTAKGYRLSESQAVGEKGKFSLEGIDITYSHDDIYGEKGLSVKATGNIELLQQIVFYDQQGKKISPSAYSETRNQQQVGILFNFADLQEVATAKLKMYNEPQDIELPIKIKVVSSATAKAAQGQAQDKINCELAGITKSYSTNIHGNLGLLLTLQCKAKEGEALYIRENQQVNAKVEGQKDETTTSKINTFIHQTNEYMPHQLPVFLHFANQVHSTPTISIDDSITITHAQELRETKRIKLEPNGSVTSNNITISYKQGYDKHGGRGIELNCTGATENICSFSFYDVFGQDMDISSFTVPSSPNGTRRYSYTYREPMRASFLKIKLYKGQQDIKVPLQFKIKHDATIL